jgi:hypothetical protein
MHRIGRAVKKKEGGGAPELGLSGDDLVVGGGESGRV